MMSALGQKRTSELTDYHLRRNNTGSLAIFATIRCCGPQLTERTRATDAGVCIYADGTLSQQEQIAAARRL